MTWKGICLTVIRSPTPAPRLEAVVAPSTITWALVLTSALVMKVPLLIERALAISQSGVLPERVVLQLLDVLTSETRPCETGATAEISGAFWRSDSPATSRMVREFALAPPPNTPPKTVLPGDTVSRLVPSDVMRAVTLSEEA